ncbi:MAG: hypothetical protein FWD85_05375 [Microbacteriaceae bacterium]|nr:hypothetical protein [Microbacteriaceae bacterium]MCL2794720.1 hypothetical protein [Microbacteriaceae bacterium]
MYGALWRVLPGPWWVRLLLLIALAAAVVFVLFEWVFPWVDGLVSPGNTGTVGT